MKVSVCMLTYNHEKFIAQAIDSVLMQKVKFDYELVIGDDCSTDRTRDILIQYKKQNPDCINLYLWEKNLGAIHNFLQILSVCKGEYIAILEGDDYWTSSEKLQKQVDFMDTHSECSICFHKVIGFYDNNPQKEEYFIPPKKIKQFLTLEDLLKENFIPTLSIMYREINIPIVPENLTRSWLFDWPFNIIIAKTGKIGYLNEVLGKYRRHENSLCSKTGVIPCYLGIVDMLIFINHYFDNKYDCIIKSTISKQYYDLSIIYLNEHDICTAKKYFIKSLNTKIFNTQISKISIIWLFIRIYVIYLFQERYSINK